MQSVMQHTPGPWRVEADGANVGPEGAFKPFGGCGCCGSPWMGADKIEQQTADALLIAAAPDLLKTLRDLYHTPGDTAAAGELLKKLGAL